MFGQKCPLIFYTEILIHMDFEAVEVHSQRECKCQ